jgi:hypothetical protein
MAWIVESDDWGAGASILAEETLGRLRAALAESPLICEHWFYRGGRAPERLVIDEYDELRAYLGRGWNPGDAFHIWRFDHVCRTENEFARGKLPDDRGRVPKRGPY